MWELGLGSFLACVFPLVSTLLEDRPNARISLLWGGLALTIVSCFLIGPAMSFPGWAQSHPPVGTAVVIAADGPRDRLGLTGVLEPRPVQFIGNISYALDLWH